MGLFGNMRPPFGGGHRRPPLSGALIGGLINSAGSAIGAAAGVAIGNAVNKVADQAANNVVNDMKMESEKKQMAINEQKKVNELPPICPHCGAATAGKLVCDYCDCKIVE
jgi:hypothetical protein